MATKKYKKLSCYLFHLTPQPRSYGNEGTRGTSRKGCCHLFLGFVVCALSGDDGRDADVPRKAPGLGRLVKKLPASPRVGSPSVPVTECGGQKVNVGFSDFGSGGSNQLRDPRLRSASNEHLRATGLIALLFLKKLVRLRTSAHGTRQSLSLFALLLF